MGEWDVGYMTAVKQTNNGLILLREHLGELDNKEIDKKFSDIFGDSWKRSWK